MAALATAGLALCRFGILEELAQPLLNSGNAAERVSGSPLYAEKSSPAIRDN
jgi:hypothetical protein